MDTTLIATVITSAVTLTGTIVTVLLTANKQSHDMDTRIAVIHTKMDNMERRIDEHNGYARMFSESIPAIRQHMTDIDRRLELMEHMEKKGN